MHESRTLLDPATDAVTKLARRGYRLDLRMLRELTDHRGSAIKDLDEARAEANARRSWSGPPWGGRDDGPGQRDYAHRTLFVGS